VNPGASPIATELLHYGNRPRGEIEEKKCETSSKGPSSISNSIVSNRQRILREIRRRTRVVGSFPDGQSALNLAAARLRHIAGTAWSTKRYLNIELLKDQQMRGAITA
jgi:transposase-like protein